MTRRKLLLATVTLPVLRGEGLNSEISERIFEAVWQGVRDEFYDPNTRGVDWLRLKDEFRPRVMECASNEQLLILLREMLSRLRNSHIFLYSREEWALRENILPFCFDLLDGRVFIRYGLRGKQLRPELPFDFGDEVISVDDVHAERLRPVTLSRLESVIGNPNFGPPNSIAEIEIRRRGQNRIVRCSRVARPAGFETVVLEHPRANISHLRLFTLGSIELPTLRLNQIWNDVLQTRGLVLDLRNCVGGDSKVSNYIAGSLLGPGKPLFRMIPRPGSTQKEVLDVSEPAVPRFNGRVALITNSNTESEPETMAAICKEYRCARIFGERTAGAFSGWTEAIGLPEKFARFALPYTRSISPKGIEYEGRGITPDTVAITTAMDFGARRDQPLLAALKYVSG